MKTKVLMVCLGNICRSPLAEGILASKVDGNMILVDSAGTAGYHIGNPPDPRSVAVARKYGIDISQQRCRKFSASDFEDFDFIYAMDDSNYDNIVALARNESDRNKVQLLMKMADNGLSEVPDPYYGGEDGFEQVFDMIELACTPIAQNLNQHGRG